jgi:hypothetical protein
MSSLRSAPAPGSDRHSVVQNVITKKVNRWAEILAIPTLITGFFGVNVPYPGLGERVGLIASTAVALAVLALCLVFKRKEWPWAVPVVVGADYCPVRESCWPRGVRRGFTECCQR